MIFLIVIFVVLLTACGGKGDSAVQPTATRVRPTSTPAPTPLPPLPTAPPLGSEENPLVMMFVVDDPEDSDSDAEQLAEEYSTVNMIVDVRLTDNYGEAYRAVCNGTAHVVSLNAFATLAASEEDCANVLYLSEINGERGVRSQMITAVGRNIFTVIGFRGQEFCRTSPDSVSTWIIPALSMRAQGVDPFTDLPVVVDKESDEEVVIGVFTRECDVGATTLGAHEGVPNPNPALSGRILVLEELPLVPFDAVLLSLKTADETRALLQDMIVGSEDDLAELIGVDALIEAEDEQQETYGELLDLFQNAGVDPAALAQ